MLYKRHEPIYTKRVIISNSHGSAVLAHVLDDGKVQSAHLYI